QVGMDVVARSRHVERNRQPSPSPLVDGGRRISESTYAEQIIAISDEIITVTGVGGIGLDNGSPLGSTSHGRKNIHDESVLVDFCAASVGGNVMNRLDAVCRIGCGGGHDTR